MPAPDGDARRPMPERPLRHRTVWPLTSTAATVRRLYLEAFPAEERVPHWFLLAANLIRPSCHYLAWYDEGRCVGMSFTYTRRDLRLLSFFAIDRQLRGSGYGQRIVNEIDAPRAGGAVILQCEPLDPDARNAEQRRRRIRFYERHGFRVIDLDSIEADQRYATMVRGRAVGREEFLHLLRGLLWGVRRVDVVDSRGQ